MMEQVVARQVTPLRNEITSLQQEMNALKSLPNNVSSNNCTNTRNNGPPKPPARPVIAGNAPATTSNGKKS